jgi:nucleotidyltransferase/DNA polymerase involved in DNA repair
MLSHHSPQASIGVAKNKLLARMATSAAKPNGQCVLLDDAEAEDRLLLSKAIRDIPSVGFKIGKELEGLDPPVSSFLCSAPGIATSSPLQL